MAVVANSIPQFSLSLENLNNTSSLGPGGRTAIYFRISLTHSCL